jgi:hypothetical protein
MLLRLHNEGISGAYRHGKNDGNRLVGQKCAFRDLKAPVRRKSWRDAYGCGTLMVAGRLWLQDEYSCGTHVVAGRN